MKRTPQIEVYRCLLMYGICLLHTIGNSLGKDLWASSLLMFCVDGFILISGYFAIHFTWKKVIALECTGIWCAFVACAFEAKYYGGVGFIVNSWHAFLQYWFLHSYVILMIFAPVLNTYVDSLRTKNVKFVLTNLAPLYALCFGWSWATSYNVTFGYVPRVSGLGHFTFLMMIGVYITGRLIRLYESRIRFQKLALILLMIVSAIFASFRLGFYNSPFAVMLALGSFIIVKALRINKVVVAIVSLISPSMFAVYLLHTTPLGMSVIIPNLFSALALHLNKWLAYLSCALALFCGGLIVDLMRRIIVYGLNWSYVRMRTLGSNKEPAR